MTQVLIILAVVIGLAAGAMILAACLFCWYLLKTMQDIKATVDAFGKVIEPMVKSGAFLAIANSTVEIASAIRPMLQAMTNINTTVGLFNKGFFEKGAVPDADVPVGASRPDTGFAGTKESFHISYDEGSAALRERMDLLRQEGYETDATRVREPEMENMTGSSV